MTEQQKTFDTIDQLWYTWSGTGLGGIRGGFQIRAASDGLRAIRTERMQNLDRYQGRYELPRLAKNLDVPVGIAPICLSFIITEKEKILVHKVYRSEDDVGRTGSFFIHLLANLPADFSATQAILLWKSTFWQRHDTLKPTEDDLLRISLDFLKKHKDETLNRLQDKEVEQLTPDEKTIAKKVEQYLPYLFQFYLTKRAFANPQAKRGIRQQFLSLSSRKQPSEPKTAKSITQPIYIVAPDEEIALMILALTRSLPEHLSRNLTFSTYEANVADAKTAIVGTCWLSVPDAEKTPYVEQLISEYYYRDRLAINCYTGHCSPLTSNPLLEDRPLACMFAQHATQYFMRKYPEKEFKSFKDFSEQFKMLLGMSAHSQEDEFLEWYKRLIINKESPIKLLLLSKDYRFIAQKLAELVYQNGLISQAIYDSKWWYETGKAAVINLYKVSASMPLLAQSLTAVAHCAMNRIVTMLKEDGFAPTNTSPSDSLEIHIRVVIDVMNSVADPYKEPQPWYDLLQALLNIKNIFGYLSKYWHIYEELMPIWANILRLPAKQVGPLLTLSWAEYGKFLAFSLQPRTESPAQGGGLPLEWIEEATKNLTAKGSAKLDEQQARALEQSHHAQIKEILHRLAQSDSHRRNTAELLFSALVEGKYSQKLQQLSMLIDSPMGQSKGGVTRLFEIARLDIQDRIAFLEQKGPQYLPLNNDKSDLIVQVFKTLQENRAGNTQRFLLYKWLDAPFMIARKHLEELLKAVSSLPTDISEFFQRHAPKYIQLYPGSPVLLELFEIYAKSSTTPHISTLSIWLNQNLERATLEHVLVAAHLTTAQCIEFLKIYGEYYITKYPQLPVLIDYVKELLKYLQTANPDIFEEKNVSPKNASSIERLLKFLQTASLPHALSQPLHDWYTVAQLIRQPTLLERHTVDIVPSVSRILALSPLSEETRIKLMGILANACLESKNGLQSMVIAMQQALSPAELMNVLGDLARRARLGVATNDYPQALLLECTIFAFKFRDAFRAEREQKHFLYTFLDTLLLDIDGPKLVWLNTQQWPPTIYATWQEYLSERPILTRMLTCMLTTSKWESLGLLWERALAFTLMQVALLSNNHCWIAKIATEYMTTLISYDTEHMDQWWRKIDKAVNQLNQDEAQSLQYDGTKTTAESLAELRVSPWQRMLSSYQIKRALQSKRIGRIAWVATNNIFILERYSTEILRPEEWKQIDAALEFFTACDKPYDSKEASSGEGINQASQKIEWLINTDYPSPRLNWHEKKLLETTKHQCHQQTQDSLEGWKPHTLRKG